MRLEHTSPSDEWFALNRASWDERVDGHLASDFYDVNGFLAGRDALGPIESTELGDVSEKRILHLQCHFGLDSLSLARRRARVTGLDFSGKAIEAARRLASEARIDATFVEGSVYDAPALIEPESFDLVFTTWGTVTWLPDISRWAKTVALMLAHGGRLYFLDAHPVALALEQTEPTDPIHPAYDYFHGDVPLVFESQGTYADVDHAFTQVRTHEWIHPISAMITALTDTGMQLCAIREHDATAWQMFPSMTRGDDGLWRLPPDVPRLPLALTLEAKKQT